MERGGDDTAAPALNTGGMQVTKAKGANGCFVVTLRKLAY